MQVWRGDWISAIRHIVAGTMCRITDRTPVSSGKHQLHVSGMESKCSPIDGHSRSECRHRVACAGKGCAAIL